MIPNGATLACRSESALICINRAARLCAPAAAWIRTGSRGGGRPSVAQMGHDLAAECAALKLDERLGQRIEADDLRDQRLDVAIGDQLRQLLSHGREIAPRRGQFV